jgi:Prolipoprotein diacylglyceryltransferase
MHPFYTVFGVQLPTYGLMILLGIVAGSIVVIIRNRHARLPGIDVLFTALFGLIGVGVGGKILYWITVIPIIARNISHFFEPDFFTQVIVNGSVFYGGLIGSLIFAYLYIRKNNMNAAVCGDLFAPAIPLFHAFGRVGCLMIGCCHGMPYEHGIVFHNAIGGAPNDIPLFPTQPLEIGYNVLIFAALLCIGHFAKKKGRLVWYYLLLYAPFRFILEFFRGDVVRGHLWIFSTSQWVSILLAGFAVFMLAKASRGHKK